MLEFNFDESEKNGLDELDDFNNLIIEHLKIYQKDAEKDLILAFHMIGKS